jgi:hypothetical protein
MGTKFQYIAFLIMGTGVVHIVLNACVKWSVVRELVKSGIFGSIESSNSSAMALLWTEVSGIALIIIGYAIYTMDSNGIRLPWAFVGLFILLAVFVVVLFPRGGAWALFAEAVLLGIMRGIS